jgi:hypothetical protein
VGGLKTKCVRYFLQAEAENTSVIFVQGSFFTVKKDDEGWMKFVYRVLRPTTVSDSTVADAFGPSRITIRKGQYGGRMYVSKLGDRTFLDMKFIDGYCLQEYELFGKDTLYRYRIDFEVIERDITDKTLPGLILEQVALPRFYCLVKCNPALVRAHIRNTPRDILFPIDLREKWKRLDSQQTDQILKYFES